MPLIKIGYLLIRTVAKPIAAAIKGYAEGHPRFRAVCLRLAQKSHRFETHLRRRLVSRKNRINSDSQGEEGGEKERPIRPLDSAKAIELGANFISEAIVFGVAGILLVLDVQGNRRAEVERRKSIEDRIEDLQTRMQCLESFSIK